MRQQIDNDIQDLNSEPEQINTIEVPFKHIKYALTTLNTQNIDRPLLKPILGMK